MTKQAGRTADSASRTEASRAFARRLAAESIANGDATGWFETLYAAAAHGTATVPWAGFAPHPQLVSTLDRPGIGGAVVVGCGLGDDAEYVASLGYVTTAFDVSRTAIATARRRFPKSTVEYVTADLLAPPRSWDGAFDLVVEIFTLQVLTGRARYAAFAHIAQLVAPGGRLLVLAGARHEGDDPGEMPWPLTRPEIEQFTTHGLAASSIVEVVDDESRGPIRRWIALFDREDGGDLASPRDRGGKAQVLRGSKGDDVASGEPPRRTTTTASSKTPACGWSRLVPTPASSSPNRRAAPAEPPASRASLFSPSSRVTIECRASADQKVTGVVARSGHSANRPGSSDAPRWSACRRLLRGHRGHGRLSCHEDAYLGLLPARALTGKYWMSVEQLERPYCRLGMRSDVDGVTGSRQHRLLAAQVIPQDPHEPRVLPDNHGIRPAATRRLAGCMNVVAPVAVRLLVA